MAKGVRVPQQLFTSIPVLASDSFTRGDGALGICDGLGLPEGGGAGKAWQFDTGCWAISTNKAVGTPTSPTTGGPLNDGELMTDPSLEATYTAGKCNTLTLDGVAPTLAQSADVHSGAKAQEFTATAAADGLYRIIGAGVVGTWYLCSAWAKRTAGADTGTRFLFGPIASQLSITAAAYTQYYESFRATTTGNIIMELYQATATPFNTVIVDDWSCKILNLSSLMSSLVLSTPDVVAEVAITMASSGGRTSTHAGLVLNLDSAATPANFILVYCHNSTVTVDEYVSGVMANKMAATGAAYSAGAVLRVFRYGTSLDVYYNNAKVGATLTMTANTNTMHGIFSTHSGNSFTNFVVQPRGTGNEFAYLDQFTK